MEVIANQDILLALRNFTLCEVGSRKCERGGNMISTGNKFRKGKEQTNEAVKEKEYVPNAGLLR